MQNYILSCESTVDLTKEYLAQREIAHIGYPFELDGECYLDDFWNSLSYEEFYCAMSRGAESKTAQINAYEFELYFEAFLKEGKDILHLCLSSGITGVMNSALIAKQHLEKKYPERKIYIVDSLAASSGSGLLMERLADLRDEGMRGNLQGFEARRSVFVFGARECRFFFFQKDAATVQSAL